MQFVPAVHRLLSLRLDGIFRPALIGAVGTALIGWGSCHPEFAFGGGWASPLVNSTGLSLPMPWNRVIIILGVLLVVAAWWLARPTSGERSHKQWLLLAIWSVPLLLVPPVLSSDAVLYADLGWIINVGQNPYLVGLTGAGGPYAPYVDPLWAGSGVAYPPLALLTNALMVAVTGSAPYLGVIAMRLPILLALAVIAWVLPKLASQLGAEEAKATWWGLANPLVMLHFVGGAHNDALMIAVALVGIWVALRGQHWAWGLLAGPAIIGAAMAFKQQAGLAVVAAAGLPIAARLAGLPPVRRVVLLAQRTIVAAVVAVATFAGVSLATGLGFGWLNWLTLMGKANTPAPFSLLAQGVEFLIARAGGDASGVLSAISAISTVVSLAVLAWILIRFADRPLAAVGWGSLAVSILGQSLHPWYLPWSLALLALVPLTRKQFGWLTGFAVGFAVWNTVQTVIWHGQP